MSRWSRIPPLAACLLCAAAGFLISTVLIYVYGDTGLCAYADLDAYHARLEDNVARLSALNGTLSAEARLTEDDPETIRVLAREIGLYAPEERIIRIQGYSGSSSAYEVGDLMRYRIGDAGRTRVFKILGVSLPLTMAAIAIILRLLERKKR